MSTDPSESDYTRLSRYLAGECTPAEKAEIDAWLDADPKRREMLASLTTAWETAGRPRGHQPANVDAAWSRMATNLDNVETRAPSVWSNPVLAVAAALVIAAVGLGMWRLAKGPALGPPVVYTTAVGDRATIGIGDGTSVVLGPSSRLTVSAAYGRRTREVTLEGQALFTVRHDESKPFRVSAGGAVVEDVGTTFSVRAYSPSDTVRVVVVEGVVTVQNATTNTSSAPAELIHAGQLGLLAGKGPALVSSVSNADDLIAWSTGQLVFDDTPMSRVAEELKRWYDVDVVVDSALALRHVTAGFSGDSIDEVARVIGTAVGARVERQGRIIAFRVAGATK